MIKPIKKTIAFCLGCLLALSASAQKVDSTTKARVEKSAFGIQASILGLWVYHEWGLSRQITLRGKVGFYTEWRDQIPGSFWSSVTVEPRWYYNLDKRVRKSKSITGNSGNFVSLQLNYLHYEFPGLAYIFLSFLNSILGGTNVDPPSGNAIAITPNWGTRSKIGRRFDCELVLGVQYYIFTTLNNVNILYFTGLEELKPYFYIRFGYRFNKNTLYKKRKKG